MYAGGCRAICRSRCESSNLHKNVTKMSKTFILHDETVNTYGFRMLTSGANLEEFRKNPVMLLNHDDWTLPIGRWENIRISGTQILADAVFDEHDPRAAEVKRKVEEGFIRMASIGAWPPEEKSESPELLLSGQTLPTVTRWTVREASIVTIGANHNALVFYDRSSEAKINLDDNASLVRLMDITNHLTPITMSLLTEVLKLQDNAPETEIVSAVRTLISNNDRLTAENKTFKAAIDAAKAEKTAARKAEAVRLVDAAIADARLDAKARQQTLDLFDKDFDAAKAMLAAIPHRGRVIAATVADGSEITALKDKSWDELDRANKLTLLRDNAPDIYRAKFKERFGVDPTNC